MRRRTFLTAVGTVGVGLAGCVSDGGDESDGVDDATTNGASTATESTTSGRSDTASETAAEMATQTPMTPTLTETTIEVQDSDCGQQVNEVEVTFASDTVVLDGTIWAPNPGHEPVVVAASYEGAADTLSVTVGTEDASDGPVVQCIAEVEYRARATFTGGLPESVTVVHETSEGSETVATVERE